jgi:hypothetical protein
MRSLPTSQGVITALGPYIQGLRLKFFFFYKVAKNMDPSMLLLLLYMIKSKEK